MKEITYKQLWEQIEKSIVEVEKSLSPDEKERLRFHRTYGENSKQEVWDEYIAIRDTLKSRCYSSQEASKQKEIRIDHHKIAACFCNVLINKKMFSFDIDDAISQGMLLSNYRLAYTVSLSIIYSYMLEMYASSQLANKDDVLQKLINQKTLIAPATSVKHDQYHIGRIKTLAINDFYGVEFDLLSYSDMMYWVEHYNRQLLEKGKDVNITPYDPDSSLQ